MRNNANLVNKLWPIPFIIFTIMVMNSCRESAPNQKQTWRPGTVYPASVLGSRRGYTILRGIIHLHTVYSHDACDGHPFINGQPNQACYNDFRNAICKTKDDFIMITDHPSNMVNYSFYNLLIYQEGDTLIYNNGNPVANKVSCRDNSKTILMAGQEGVLMPVGMESHIGLTLTDRSINYSRDDAYMIAQYKNNGAVVFVNHTEGRDAGYLMTAPVDGVEIYNIHSNIDPDIRQNDLGLDPYGFMAKLSLFLNTSPNAPDPNLAFLSFFTENTNDIAKWDAITLDRKMVGIAATDVHENAFPMILRDGERGDSYRRLMEWFSNYVLAKHDDYLSIKDALREGRLYVCFDILGLAYGFDFHALLDGITYEMGEELPYQDGIKLYVSVPRVYRLESGVIPPDISAELLKVDQSGEHVVHSAANSFSYAVQSPGVYRIVVYITPYHLIPYLGQYYEQFMQKYVWVYSNPIYIR